MFAAFFYLLRQRGLHVSLNEWMTLLEGMEKGLHHLTLTGFYHLCRAIVVKNETEFDRFDQIFLEFFKNVPYTGELPEDLLDWLNHPSEDLKRTIADLRSAGFPDETLEELLKMLEERLKEQTEEHNGGNYWVGTQGRTPWGNSGWHPNGIRIGGQSMHRTAMMVAGERKFRDFRKDNKLDTRQFQMAFRTLRQLSAQERSAEKELDVDATIHDTCESAGRLEIRYRNPRKNTVKVLLLMDSGGSMDYYSGLCSQLFQAATNQRQDRRDVLQPFTRLVIADDTEIFQIERQIVRQLAAIQLQPGFLILAHQVDHRLAAIAGLGMNMFEQQQRCGTSTVKHFAPFGLFIQQRRVKQVAGKIRKHRCVAADQRQRVLLTFP